MADPMSDGFWLDVQDRRVADLEAEVKRLLEALAKIADDRVAGLHDATAPLVVRDFARAVINRSVV